MQNSRLLQLLETFSRTEAREFGQFVRSPFFNRQPELTAFYDLWYKSLTGKSILPPKEAAFRILFPGDPYNDTRMRLLMSRLLKLAEQYLVIKDWQSRDVSLSLGVLSVYRKKNLPAHFASAIKSVDGHLEAGADRSLHYFEARFLIEKEQYRFNSSHLRIKNLNLQEVHDQLDLVYVVNKLRYACLTRSRQQVYPQNFDIGILPAILVFILEKGLLKYPAVALYYHALQCLENPDDGLRFDQFKNHLVTHLFSLPREEARDLLLIAINYCIRRLNDGIRSFALEGLALYQFGLEKDILAEQGELSRFTYRNIAAMAIKTNALDWAESFLHQYRDSLPEAYRERMFSFSMAQLAYHRRQFAHALNLLQKTEYQDLLLNLAAKTLQLKIYFETDEFDLLQSHLDAMKVFLGRKRVMGYHRANYLAIIRYTKKLLALNPYDKTAVEKFRHQIETEESFTELEWFQKQINELM